MYVQAVETKPDTGFKVVHHADTNLIEDPEEDPVGLFLNEYAVGKNADIFPANAGRLIKAGSKIHFNLHLHPGWRGDSGQHFAWPEAVSERAWCRSTSHSRSTWARSPIWIFLPARWSRSDGYFRLPKPAVLSAFQPHFHTRGKAQCMEAIYPDVRADSARPGAARTETLSCVSNYQFGWSITYPYAEDVAPLLPAGTVIHVTTWHDNTDHNPHQSESEKLGGISDSGPSMR